MKKSVCFFERPVDIYSLRKTYRDGVEFVTDTETYPMAVGIRYEGPLNKAIKGKLAGKSVKIKTDRLVELYKRRLFRVWDDHTGDLVGKIALAGMGKDEEADKRKKRRAISEALGVLGALLAGSAMDFYRRAYMLGKDRGVSISGKDVKEVLSDSESQKLLGLTEENKKYLDNFMRELEDKYVEAVQREYEDDKAREEEIRRITQANEARLSLYANAALGALAAGLVSGILEGRQAVRDEAEEIGVPLPPEITGIVWVTARDEAVCPGCADNDGKFFTMGEFEAEYQSNECLVRCRCAETSVPTTDPPENFARSMKLSSLRKGGPGSGSWEGPGQPRFAWSPESGASEDVINSLSTKYERLGVTNGSPIVRFMLQHHKYAWEATTATLTPEQISEPKKYSVIPELKHRVKPMRLKVVQEFGVPAKATYRDPLTDPVNTAIEKFPESLQKDMTDKVDVIRHNGRLKAMVARHMQKFYPATGVSKTTIELSDDALSDPKMTELIMTHELSHALDYSYNKKVGSSLSDTKEFKEVMLGKGTAISKYALRSEKEFFAEHVVAYLYTPAKLKEINPGVYDYMEKLFAGTQTFTKRMEKGDSVEDSDVGSLMIDDDFKGSIIEVILRSMEKSVKKGGPGSGSWEGPGQPRFAWVQASIEEANDFHTAIFNANRESKYKGFVTVYPAEEYAKMKVYLNEEKNAGYAITPDGEIASVFNRSGKSNMGQEMLRDAILAGGDHLYCFDGFLTGYYGKLGFAEEERFKFDDSLAPEGWDYTAHGRPDIVRMKYKGAADDRQVEIGKSQERGGEQWNDRGAAQESGATRAGNSGGDGDIGADTGVLSEEQGKKQIGKGGSGSGSWEGPGQPRFAWSPANEGGGGSSKESKPKKLYPMENMIKDAKLSGIYHESSKDVPRGWLLPKGQGIITTPSYNDSEYVHKDTLQHMGRSWNDAMGEGLVRKASNDSFQLGMENQYAIDSVEVDIRANYKIHRENLGGSIYIDVHAPDSEHPSTGKIAQSYKIPADKLLSSGVNLRSLMTDEHMIKMEKGGPGSGCQGPNCGRPKGSVGDGSYMDRIKSSIKSRGTLYRSWSPVVVDDDFDEKTLGNISDELKSNGASSSYRFLYSPTQAKFAVLPWSMEHGTTFDDLKAKGELNGEIDKNWVRGIYTKKTEYPTINITYWGKEQEYETGSSYKTYMDAVQDIIDNKGFSDDTYLETEEIFGGSKTVRSLGEWREAVAAHKVEKGGPGSGSWEGPGQPRFAWTPTTSEKDIQEASNILTTKQSYYDKKGMPRIAYHEKVKPEDIKEPENFPLTEKMSSMPVFQSEVSVITGTDVHDIKPLTQAEAKEVYDRIKNSANNYPTHLQSVIEDSLFKVRLVHYGTRTGYAAAYIPYQNGTTEREETIEINWDEETGEFDKNIAMSHEMAHVLDYGFKKRFGTKLSDTKEWLEAIKEGTPITEYARTNTREYFAEHVTAYLYIPDKLKEVNPKAYDLVDKLFKQSESKKIMKKDIIRQDDKIIIDDFKGSIVEILSGKLIEKGGPGSGCQGPNCGRPKGSALVRDFRPAINLRGRVYEGKAGQTHGDVVIENPEVEAGLAEAIPGFVDPEGKFYTRSQMHGLTSEDVRELQEKLDKFEKSRNK